MRAIFFLCLLAPIPGLAQSITWQPLGPPGGEVRELVFPGATTGFAATFGGGIYRTINSGQSWAPVNNGLIDLGVLDLAFAGLDVGLAATGSGVYRSVDGGTSWNRMTTGLPAIGLQSVLFTSAQVAYVGGNDGNVYRSLDTGLSWTRRDSGLAIGEPILALDFASTTVGFAGTLSQGVVFRTSDGGGSWSPGNSGLGLSGVFTLAAPSTNVIYAGGPGGVYRSSNGGVSWSPVNNGITDTTIFTLSFVSNSTGLAGSRDGEVYRTTNGGASWTSLNPPPVGNINALGSNTAGTFIGASAGVYLSNGVAWSARNNGLDGGHRIAALATDRDLWLAGTQSSGLYRSANAGLNWQFVNAGLSSSLAVAALALPSTSVAYAGLPGAGVFHSGDGGQNWQLRAVGLGSTQIQDLWFFDDNTGLAATADTGIYRTTDAAQNWGPANSGLGNPTVNRLDFPSAGTGYAATASGVYRSSNGGQSWSGAGLTGQSVGSLSFPTTNLGYAGTTDGLFLTTNGGGGWQPLNTGLAETAILDVAFVDINEGYVSTLNGPVYRTTNGGQSWTPLPEGLPRANVNVLALDAGRALAGTRGFGIFTRDAGSIFRDGFED